MLQSRFPLTLLTAVAILFAAACAPSSSEAVAESQTEATEDVQADATAPTNDATPSANTDEPTEPEVAQTPETNRTGEFVSAEHATAGSATLSVAADGTQTLTFDSAFSTSNGPDLVIVLHRSADVVGESTPPAYPLEEGDYVVIEPLQSTDGTQAYVIPADINVADYQSVAVWCQQFNATFGAAPLN